MKTIRCILILLLFVPSFSYAQDPTCECEESEPKEKSIVFCPFDGVDEYGNPISNPTSTIFTVKYMEVMCPGQGVTIQILGTTLTTSWFNFWSLGWIPNSPCPDIHPNDMNDFPAWDLWRNKMFSRLFFDSIIPWQSIYLSWRGGCNALLAGKWPAGTYVSTNNEASGGYTQHSLAGYDAFFTVPCNNTPCCLYKIERDNQGHEVTVLIENHDCTGATPDGGFDPFIGTEDENGEIVEFRPIISNISECHPMCAGEGWSPSIIVEKEEIAIELGAAPAKISSSLQVSSSKPAEKAVVYNMKGERVLEKDIDSNGDLDLSKLPAGMYFMQVYFEGNQVKSIKIYKEN